MKENLLQIAVCDDIEADANAVSKMTKELLLRMQYPCVIHEFKEAKELLGQIKNGVQYQLLLLDVVMEEMNGIELAAELRKKGRDTSIIFMSTNRDMALLGYEVSAARYLAKPVQEEKLQEALDYCLKCWNNKKEMIVPTTRGQQKISLSDIRYVEAHERGSHIVLDGEVVKTKLKFSEITSLLPQSGFIQCHRAYVVNVAQTKRIRPYEFEMKSGEIVPISKYRYSEVNRLFVECLTN